MKDLWSTSAQYRDEYQRGDEIETIVRLLDLRDADTLVDVGCGNGAFSLAAARAYPRLKLRAFDALDSAVDAFRLTARDLDLDGDRVEVARADAASLPLSDAVADRVLCRAVLHHLPDAAAAYREFARVLRSGGLLLLQAPGNYWGKQWGGFLTELYRLMDDSHRRTYHQPAAIIEGLNDVGLLMRVAACWTYTVTDLNDAQVELIRQHAAEQRVRLRRSPSGAWQCDLYWVRVIAIKDR